MRTAAIRNLTHPLPAPLKVGVCDSFTTRLKGWMFTPQIQPQEGLILLQAAENRLDAAIHMLFVGFDLGVIWLDHDSRVVDLIRARSWALFYQPCSPAKMILEIHPDRLSEFCQGDILALDYE